MSSLLEKTSNMKTATLEQDPNAVLNFIGFTPGDGANPVLKESLRLLNILTPFHPVLPVQDIFTIKSKGDEHSGQSWGRTIFFWKSLKLIIIKNTNWSFINRSSSTKTSVLFQFHWHLFETASLVPPSPISWSKAIAISSSLKWCWSEKIFGYFFAKKINTYAAKLKWKWIICTSSLPSTPFFSWS